MDLNRIFLKDACPTTIGGQAIMEGIMMRGPKRTSIAVRLPNGKIHMKTQPSQDMGVWAKVPLVRGVIAFVTSLVFGTKVLMYSADVLEKYLPEEYQQDKFDEWIEKKVGKDRAWNILLWLSVIIALIFSIGVFMLLPTAVVGIFKKLTDSVIILNLIEGLVRIGIFIGYIALIPKLEYINKVFQYHGAEHKTIHCFENDLLHPAPSLRNFVPDVRNDHRHHRPRVHGLAQRVDASRPAPPGPATHRRHLLRTP